MAWHDGLTERQRKFCEIFSANGGNALDAARQSGYKTPHVTGYRILDSKRVKVALEELRKVTTSDAIATREERQSFWTAVMRGTHKEKVIVEGVEYEIPSKMTDRLKASELLGKSQADFLDRTELTGAVELKEIRRVIVDPKKD